MHALHAKPLVVGKNFYLREILFFLCRGLPDCPIKISLCHKIRQSDDGNPVEIGLAGIVNAFYSVLPPESFQGRYHIIKVSVDLMVTLLAHFDCEGNSVQQSYSLLIFTIFLIRITAAAHGNIIHARHSYDTGLILRQIKLLILLFEIKSHQSLPPRILFFKRFIPGTYLNQIPFRISNITGSLSPWFKLRLQD